MIAMAIVPEEWIPVICVDPSTVVGAELFNPNAWEGGSKGVIQSCWSEYAVLHYCVHQLSEMCEGGDKICANNIATIQDQWKQSKFDLNRVACLGQQPDLHIRIEAFFSGVKSLLDLIVQILSTDRVVAAAIDGFHRDGDVYGGRVLKALRNNATKEKKAVAEKIDALISEHKKKWIDRVIAARDQLVHPAKGMHQLMFYLEFTEEHGALIFVRAHPPHIESTPIHKFAGDILDQTTVFCSNLLKLLNEKAVSTR
ncbi:MAG: hypothetical protein EPO27_00875 [Betaproteobacteria bacterium]|nr:MAG: hypothetical protein EPO27_00875 [Betaproteobacteria bacterium]